MSRVSTLTAPLHQQNVLNQIRSLLDSYAGEKLQQSLQNMTLCTLYAMYKLLTNTEQKKLLKNLTINQKIDLTSLTNQTQPVIELVTAEHVIVLDQNCTVAYAKNELLSEKSSKNNHIIIVTDAHNQYRGIVELHRLLSCDAHVLLAHLLSFVTKLHISEQQKNAANIIVDNDDNFAVLVDNQGALIGLIRLTDLLKKQVNNKDQLQSPPYLKISVLSHVRQRIFWIIGLATVGLLSGVIIQSYDDAITALIILAFYMPMVADTGGNAGSQAATVIIRSIAIGELRLNDWWAVLYKELRISLFIGLGLACVSFLKISFLSYGIELPDNLTLQVIAFAIALAIFVQVISATVIGASLPLLVKWCKQDPAVVASPAITTIVDVTGLLIYFYITSAFLFI